MMRNKASKYAYYTTLNLLKRTWIYILEMSKTWTQNTKKWIVVFIGFRMSKEAIINEGACSTWSTLFAKYGMLCY